MKIITARSLILKVTDRWREQYRDSSEQWHREVLSNLENLDLQKTSAKTIEEIIGNNTWTSIHCDECKKRVDFVIQLGEEPDYESSTANICKKCFKKALKLLTRSCENG